MRARNLIAVGVLAGCGKKLEVENHYYSLVLEAADGRTPVAHTPKAALVELVEVHLPDFLESRSLALQVNSNEVRLARYHHWGEPLDLAIRKVLAWDLAAALPTIAVTPEHDRDADCTLTLDFDRFHSSTQARLLVSGHYTFVHGETVHHAEFDVSRPQTGDGYTSAVRGLRAALDSLQEELRPVVEQCTPAPTAP